MWFITIFLFIFDTLEVNYLLCDIFLLLKGSPAGECTPSTCMNGGTWLDYGDDTGYVCACSNGFQGVNCESFTGTRGK